MKFCIGVSSEKIHSIVALRAASVAAIVYVYRRALLAHNIHIIMLSDLPR